MAKAKKRRSHDPNKPYLPPDTRRVPSDIWAKFRAAYETGHYGSLQKSYDATRETIASGIRIPAFKTVQLHAFQEHWSDRVQFKAQFREAFTELGITPHKVAEKVIELMGATRNGKVDWATRDKGIGKYIELVGAKVDTSQAAVGNQFPNQIQINIVKATDENVTNLIKAVGNETVEDIELEEDVEFNDIGNVDNVEDLDFDETNDI